MMAGTEEVKMLCVSHHTLGPVTDYREFWVRKSNEKFVRQRYEAAHFIGAGEGLCSHK